MSESNILQLPIQFESTPPAAYGVEEAVQPDDT